VQYTDGTAYDKSLDSSGNPVINITGNSEGQYGNEWGVNFHLNGYWNGVAGDETHPLPNPVASHTYLASAPTAEWQQGMLDLSADNGGMSIQDQAYQFSNRTSVTVSNTGSDANQGSPLSSLASIQAGINAVVAGGKVNVAAGTYAASGEIDVNKSLTLAGAGVGSTIINSTSTGYGMFVDADGVTLSGFTFNGPASGTYGIKVQPNPSGYSPSDRLLNFTIENVAINGSKKTGLDLNGVTGATINHVTVSNTTNGNGIALTDSANVTITSTTTSNNAWGGLALYQHNSYYDQQLNNITVDGTNTFNEANGIYLEDESDGVADPGHGASVANLDVGTLNIAGYSFVAVDKSNSADQYTFFQKTEQNAIDFATNAALNGGHLTLANTYVEGWSGTSLNGNFYVGTGANSSQLLIATAIGAASAGNTINVDAGTYAEDVAVGTQLAFNFDGATVNSLTIGSGAAGSSVNGDLTATGAIAFNGATTVNGDLTAASFTSNATLAMTGDLTASGAVALNGASTITGDVGAASLTTGSTLALVGDLTATNGVTFGGASTVTGDITAKTFTSNGTLALKGNLSASGDAVFNGASSITGNVKAASLTASNSFALNGNATASGAIALNGANTLSGNVTGGSIALGATTLGGDTTLDTSGSNGAIQVASVSGAHALSVNAGTGDVSLGNVGGVTSLSDASATTLTGSSYNAGSFVFGGDVTLTAATTTLSTNGGDITFNGDIFGMADGAQSLTLNAGPGTNSGANGDITLQNAGTSSVRLGDMTVSGNDFTALTVWLAGSYNSTLAGNQVFAADTLHTGGNVNSTVGGNASGHIESDGDVNIAATGDVSGTINGQNVTLAGDDVNASVTATDTASVTGNTVEGSYSADTVSISANNNVDAAVTATDFTLSAKNGSVDGTWTNLDASGSGVVSVNGQTVVGEANFNPAQLVVEGFVLPAGTTIGPNGQLILPQGVLLGLLSPGGGKPKMILVHTVQDLGQLLAEGYSVIVIDLSGKDKGKPIQLASN
jgi:cytoskeletal protein CcmA (bactofilin family)